jgi:hypothetical protein
MIQTAEAKGPKESKGSVGGTEGKFLRPLMIT